MNLSRISFHTLVLGLGGVITLGVFFHMYYRGPEIYPMAPVWEVRFGDARRGEELITRYGCGSCHVIPGVRKATGRVGPRLQDLQNQIYLAGVLPNTPDNLVKWIQDPRRFSPRTAMPDLNVTPQDARDIAAYLMRDPKRERARPPGGAQSR